MRRLISGFIVTLLTLGGLSLIAAPAEAASKPLSIKALKFSHQVGWDSKAKVKPSFSKKKKVKVTSISLRATHVSTKKVTKGKTVSLTVGTYIVRTTVTYKYKGKKKVAKRAQRIKVAQGKCATNADYLSIKIDSDLDDAVLGDSIALAAKKLGSTGEGESGSLQDDLDEANFQLSNPNIDAEDKAYYEEEKAYLEELIAAGYTTYEVRIYERCGAAYGFVGVLFLDGEAVDKIAV